MKRNGSEHKISLYVDDMLLYVSDPLSSLPKTHSGRISGYTINLQKSEIMPLNAVAESVVLSKLSLKVSPHIFKYLGIWVTHDFKKPFYS